MFPPLLFSAKIAQIWCKFFFKYLVEFSSETIWAGESFFFFFLEFSNTSSISLIVIGYSKNFMFRELQQYVVFEEAV